MTPKKILVATDFSPAADLAVQRALMLAKYYRAELRFIHVLPPQRWLGSLLGSRQEWTQLVHKQASVEIKAQAARAATDYGIEVSTGLVTGKASVAIAAATELFAPHLLVIGARGEGMRKSTEPGLGHTATQLMGRTTVPLLLVRRDATTPLGKVLAALDLTPASRHVASWADSLAAKGELTVIHVYEAPYADRLRGYGVSRKAVDVYARDQQVECEQALRVLLHKADVSNRTNRIVLRGDAIRLITAQIRKLKIDTLVIGKHTRRKRDAAAPYGSVCNHLANYAPVDVLVVP